MTTGNVRCWTCVGNGRINHVVHGKPWSSISCPDCGGTGIDRKATDAYRAGGAVESFVLKELTVEDLEDAGILRR